MHNHTRTRATLRLLSVVVAGFISSASARTTSENGLAAPSHKGEPAGTGCVDDTWAATSLLGAPSPRASHTAVWTGSEMIIWGGLWTDYVEAYPLDTGARYDPATDTWTPTTQEGAPEARFGHTAVWTGTEMIIWGGNYAGNTGARYDPASDTWTPTSRINAPFPRAFHAAVWTGTEMIIWGGAATNAGRYNPASDTWATAEAPGYQTRYPAAAWTGTELIVWGGSIDFDAVDTGRRYDPAHEYWTVTSRVNAPSPRTWHTGVWTGSEMIVWGGYRFEDLLDTGGRYDPLTDSWTATRISPSGRYSHTGVWTGSEMIIFGGQGGGGGARYDPATDTWLFASGVNAPTFRMQHTAVWTGTEMIVWGGYDLLTNLPLDTGGRYCAYR